MNNDFEENDYGFNDFKETGSDFSNDLNNFESKLVDIRIILTNIDYLEYVSKAVSNFDLSNFNVNISSIIPTKDIEIAKNTITGADLILVATESNGEGQELYQNLKQELKNDFNFIEYLKLPSLEELNDYEYGDYADENILEDEIANSIIRGGLYSISNLSSINQSKRMYDKIKNEFDEESLKFDKISKENELLIKESKAFREKNEKLLEEVKILQRQLDKIKSDYSDLKSRFEGIHSKNSLEVFSLNDLWYDLFNEYLSEDIYKFILISTDNFRPKNLMIGQGAICAESKEDALDWLKIIKTAFILADTNKQDLDYNNFNSNFKFEDISENENVYSQTASRHNESHSISSDAFDDYPFNSSIFDNSEDSASDRSVFGSSIDSSSDRSVFGSSIDSDHSDFKLKDIDDGFIYNERFEGNDVLSNSNNDFDLAGGESNESSDTTLEEIFDSKLKKEERTEEINVFNLKSLKSNDDEDDKEYSDDPDYDENDEYDYDEGEYVSDDLEEDISNAFSNLWD